MPQLLTRLAILLLVLPGFRVAAQSALAFSLVGALPDGGRYGMGYCQDQRYFYIVGGGSLVTAYTSDLFRYDPLTNSWSGGPLSSGQVGPHRFGTAALLSPALRASPVYVLNSATSTGPLPTMPNLRPSDGFLAATFSNPLPATTAAVAVWNGLLYAYGGQLASGAYTDQLRGFNPITSSWTTLAPMPEAKSTYGAAVNGKLYAIGGYNEVVNSARIDAYDIASNQWQALGTLPSTVSNQAVVVQGEWLWLIRDFTNQGYLAAYNTRTGQLRSFTSNLPPRRNAAAAIYNNKLYVWGGNTAASNATTLADMWVANVSTVLGAGPAAPAAPVVWAYPNPSMDGLLTLALPATAQQVQVCDGVGRQLALAQPPAGRLSYQLDLRGQPAGLYLVRVCTAEGRVATCRLVRQQIVHKMLINNKVS